MARLVHPPKRRSKNLLESIIHGMEQEYSPSAALSLDPEGPKVLFRISSLGPYEPAIGPGGTNSRTAEMVGSVKRSPWGNSSWGGSGCIGFPLIRRLGRERSSPCSPWTD